MKKIGLVVGGKVPVPDVQGGAIEKLMQILIEENEKHKKVKFYVYSIYHEEAVEQARKFENTTFCHIKYNIFLDSVYWFITHAIKKIFRYETKYDSIYYKRVIEQIRKDKLDYVVAEGGIYSNFRNLIPEISRENIFLHIHHHYIPDKTTAACFDNIIGISDFVLKEYQSNIQRELNLRLCRNCADNQNFEKRISVEERNELRKKLGYSEGDFVIFYCGRIVEVKGVLELINAVLSIDDKNVKLLIIGTPNYARKESSEYYKKIVALVEKNQNRVKHLGYIENSKLYQYYQSVDLQVIPSLWEEAAGIVAIEGMLNGIPLIVTKSGGMIEYISEKCAKIIEKDDKVIANIKEAIIEIYSDESLRIQMKNEALLYSKRYQRENYYYDFLNAIDESILSL